ncbi:MAG: hypothetical protein EKK42_13525 [Pseudonocardiaceae bacterium]|nr:MAG: hypothetical protein EKK42_13525 [Pseudonocardiaceae bacterium]
MKQRHASRCGQKPGAVSGVARCPFGQCRTTPGGGVPAQRFRFRTRAALLGVEGAWEEVVVPEPVGVRSEYLLDAGRSHTIHDALQPVLSEIRSLLGATTALVAYRPTAPDADLLVLAADAPDLAEPPLPNETFRAGMPAVRRAAVLADLDFVSTLRPYRVRLRSAVVVPWRDAYGDGMIVVGHTEERPRLPAPAADLVRRLRGDVRRGMVAGRRDGAGEINRDLQRAMKDIAAATVDCEDVGEALTTLLVSAKCDVPRLLWSRLAGFTRWLGCGASRTRSV